MSTSSALSTVGARPATAALRAAAAAVPLATPIAHEGAVRACAVIFETDFRLCLITCDALIIPPRVLAEVTAAVASAAAVRPEHVLCCATHSHHLPSTLDFLGCRPDEAWCDAMRDAMIGAARAAGAALDQPGAEAACRAEIHYAETQEATVGRNSRILLKDGMVGWYGYHKDDMVRPTGPYDPDIPVLAVRRPDGRMVSLLFAVAVHNIGSLTPGVHSAGFLGLAAQALESRHGGVGIFLPGAFGSSHNRTHECSGVPAAEAVHRVVAAVEEGLENTRRLAAPTLRALRREFVYRTRIPDEAREEAAVRAYAEKYLGAAAARHMAVFREMRAELRRHPGAERRTALHAFRLGDVAFVGVPGELFARLGLAIRRRSPFRHTHVLGLVNGEIGYIPDRAAYDLGGYQLWSGGHSQLAAGTGEALVDAALGLLEDLAADA